MNKHLLIGTLLPLLACDSEVEDDLDMEAVERSGTMADDVEVVAQFNPLLGETPESVAVGFDGSFYLSMALTGEIRKISPEGEHSTLALLPLGNPQDCQGPFPAIMGAVAVDLLQNVYVGVSSCDSANKGIWRVSPSGATKRIASLPPVSLANGIAVRGARVYVADSASTKIWRAPVTGNGAPAEVWTDEPLLADPNPFDLAPGANGLQFYGGSVYVANAGAATIVEIPFDLGGFLGANLVADEGFVKYGPAETDPEVVLAPGTMPGCDDFAFDLVGRIYCTTDPFQTVVRIDHDGDVEVLLDAEDGLDGPAAATFGRGTDITTLYLSNASFPFFPSTGSGPSLMAVDLGFPGYPFR